MSKKPLIIAPHIHCQLTQLFKDMKGWRHSDAHVLKRCLQGRCTLDASDLKELRKRYRCHLTLQGLARLALAYVELRNHRTRSQRTNRGWYSYIIRYHEYLKTGVVPAVTPNTARLFPGLDRPNYDGFIIWKSIYQSMNQYAHCRLALREAWNRHASVLRGSSTRHHHEK